MSITTDPKDPRLKHYTGPENPGPQGEVYLVLSQEERAKGFVRPVRTTYQHVGMTPPKYPVRELTPEEKERFKDYGYLKFEEYPAGSPVLGKYWTRIELEKIRKGCRMETIMGPALAETYARNPKFYGATYCCGCHAHFPVEEFVWKDTDERVGS